MKNRSFLVLSLLALLLAACAPQAATEIPSQSAQPTAPATLQVEISSPTPEAAPTEALASTAVPVVTSRGPELHATDPSMVSLASGQLQLVEFFRFT